MRKTILLFALVALMLTATAHAQSISVTVNGSPVAFDQPPISQNGRVLVPLRGVFERLGATVVWDAATRGIHAQSGSNTIDLTIGSTMAMVNGQGRSLDSPPMEVGGRTLVPLRFISEALGANVTWNAASNSVAILSTTAQGPPSQTYQPPIAQQPPPLPAQPVIQSVNLNNRGPIPAGHLLRVTMHGTQQGTATFDVGDRTGNPMQEGPFGTYTGSYTVRANDRERNAVITVHLMLPNGQSTSINANETVALEGGGNGLPPPGYGAALINSVVHNGTNTLTLGQSLRVTMTGASGGQAWFDLGSHTGIMMQEVTPGTYVGSYTIGLGDMQPNATILAHLKLFNGQQQTMVAPPSVSILGVPR
jgi:hypothetical protein